MLYYLGELLPGDQISVAVVGTRNPTSYGKEAATTLSRDLASAGITIVSGLALGIDGVSHRAALECGGRTIAVVAGGLDTVYPREHAGLFRQIQERGAVVSEHRLGVRPDARNFPRRNRLISGMTLGTLVVEAGEGSGTRWTVQQALEQDREVFCVPGSIFSPASKFTNQMIKEGAKLVAEYTDVLEELKLPEIPAGAAHRAVLQNPQEIAVNQIKKEEDLEGLDADEASLVAPPFRRAGSRGRSLQAIRDIDSNDNQYVDFVGTKGKSKPGWRHALCPRLLYGGGVWQLSL